MSYKATSFALYLIKELICNQSFLIIVLYEYVYLTSSSKYSHEYIHGSQANVIGKIKDF